MKTYKYITLAVLALGFTACTQDDDFAPQQEDIVKIASANIATEVQTRVNTLDDGTLWENNDRILLVNNSRDNKNSGIYTYNGTAWSLAEGMVLYALSGSNGFTAYYPAVATFTLPTDQRTEAGIKSADRMIATQTGVATGNVVELNFVRQNAKVTITPSFNTEFGDDATISSLTIAGITPYHPSVSDYTAILAPATGFTVTVKVKVGEAEQTLTATTATPIEAGKHYTFNLTVGKTAVNMGTVSVTLWTGATIDGGVAEEVLPDIDASTMTADEVKAKVAELLKAGDTSITVRFAPDTQTEMHQAIIEAIGAQTTTGAVISGNNEDSFFPEYTIYPTFADAVTNWTDGTTLTLLADVPEISEQIEISGNDLVLDLNGKSMTSTISNTLSVTGGELTIRDNVGTGSFTTTGYTVLLVNNADAIVNFESGTLQAVRMNRGVFNMTGGKIYSETWYGIDYSAPGTVNVSGGEVTSTKMDAIYNIYGTLTVSDTAKITSTNGYAINNTEVSVSTTISGDVVLSGSKAEFYLYKKILLNTQPTGGTQWKVSIHTDVNTGIENGIFATPGEGVTLNPANFASAMDGYEVQKLEDGSLALVQVATE
ncbi:MAG: fimbrillin family protein [Bacteroidaceae bacterium]|nr:fimbrillin family protein [Bacteroidaceae bacterium]